jgi:hypothetical protein
MTTEGITKKFLTGLQSNELLLKLTWDEWLAIQPPYADRKFTLAETMVRYRRNGYEWDMHGTLFSPQSETDARRAFVFFHGGAGSEKIMDLTPDGRPGLARALAAQGFKVLTLTYPGHYPPGGVWKRPVAERHPIYLMDRDLPEEEIRDRNLKCTFNVILEGAALLTDQNLAVDQVSRRSPNSFKESGYIDPEDLTPWGGADDYIRLVSPLRSQMKTSLCDNQHNAAVGILAEYAERTGLPREEYFDHLQEPDPDWLKTIRVLLTVGENDKGHWVKGDKLEDKREMFMAAKYAAATRGAHVVLLPRYGHVGYAELYNEKIVYLWLWAYKSNYFE